MVELTRLGDVITMLPAVEALSRHFTQARIHLVVDSRYCSFLQALGLPCEIHGIEKPESLPGFVKAVGFVRALNVDLALSMSPPKRNAAVTLTSGAPRKVGYLTFVHSLTPYLQTTPVEALGCDVAQHVSYGRENIEERSLKLCDALGIRRDGAGPVVHLGEEIMETKRKALSARGEMPAREFIVIHPFSGWEYRSWSLDRYNRLAEMLLERTSYAIVFVCEKAEEKMLEASRRRFSNRDDVSFFVSDDLLATAVVLKDAALVVCNDSGPLHLTSALGTRCVALFGPAPASLTAPRRAAGTFLYKKTECSPCNQCACVRPENSCMSLISPEEVLEATVKELSVVPAVTAVANA